MFENHSTRRQLLHGAYVLLHPVLEFGESLGDERVRKARMKGAADKGNGAK